MKIHIFYFLKMLLEFNTIGFILRICGLLESKNICSQYYVFCRFKRGHSLGADEPVLNYWLFPSPRHVTAGQLPRGARTRTQI